MYVISNAVVLVTCLFVQFAAPVPFTLRRFPSADQSSSISTSVSVLQGQLGPRLSKHAALYFPNNPKYANLTERWSLSAKPDFTVVMVPGVENDVAATVRFASRHNIPFLAVNKAHGTALDLSNIRHGISIYVNALDSISIDKGGNTATLGGGTFQDQVVRFLDSHGKASPSGACACVGMMGPGLGGGFGRYQGFFGLVLDNIIEMNVVLADGSLVKVSDSSHADLYWGMRGAGHNFGIVTKFKYRIYDNPAPNWTIATLILTQENLEEYFTLINKLSTNQPRALTAYASIAVNPQMSTTEPVIISVFQYGGAASDLAPILEPFRALGPVVDMNTTVSYSESAHTAGAGLTDDVCKKTGSWKLFPAGLLKYNITTMRAVYKLHKDLVTKHPEFSRSVVQCENYPMQGVQSIDSATTAYAHRGDNILVRTNLLKVFRSMSMAYPDPSGDTIATTYGRQARALFHGGDFAGRPLNTYVNYASDNENPEQLYGYELWRQQRLKALKRRYDPQNKFGFYNPIIQ